MAASINASTSAGVVTTADTSGNLNLQSNGVTVFGITANGIVAPTFGVGTVVYSNVITAMVTGSNATTTFTDTGASLSLVAGTYIVQCSATILIGGATGTYPVGAIPSLLFTYSSNTTFGGNYAGFANATTPNIFASTSINLILVVSTTTTYKTRFGWFDNSGSSSVTQDYLMAGTYLPHRIIATRIA